jgi:hypothetical protein
VPVAPSAGYPQLPEVVPDDPFATTAAAAPTIAPQGAAPVNASAPSAPYAVPGAAPAVAPAIAAGDAGNGSNRWSKKSKKQRRSLADNQAPGLAPPWNQSRSPQATRPVSGESPLARGFIHLVNENYGGNIGKALADGDMRRYAQAVGLIGSEQDAVAGLSPERSELVRQILADQRQDAGVRLNAARMLLKPAPAGASDSLIKQ